MNNNLIISGEKKIKKKGPSADNIFEYYKKVNDEIINTIDRRINEIKEKDISFLLLSDDSKCDCELTYGYRPKCFHCKNLYILSDFESNPFKIETGKLLNKYVHYKSMKIEYSDKITKKFYSNDILNIFNKIKEFSEKSNEKSELKNIVLSSDKLMNSFLVKLTIKHIMEARGFNLYVNPITAYKCNEYIHEIFQLQPYESLNEYLDSINKYKQISPIFKQLLFLMRSLKNSAFIFDQPNINKFIVEEKNCDISYRGLSITSSKTLSIFNTKGCSINSPEDNTRFVPNDPVIESEFYENILIYFNETIINEIGLENNLITYKIIDYDTIKKILKLKSIGIPIFHSSFDLYVLFLQFFTHPNVRPYLYDEFYPYLTKMFLPDDLDVLESQLDKLFINNTINYEQILELLINKNLKMNLISILWEQFHLLYKI